MLNETQAALVEQSVTNYKKMLDGYMENYVKTVTAMVLTLTALKEAGIEDVPDVTESNCRWGVHIQVKNTRDWGKIHQVIGKLEKYDMTPVGDGRANKVRVVLRPLEHDAKYSLAFEFVRKLTEKDKCKVVTETVSQTRVVCRND